MRFTLAVGLALALNACSLMPPAAEPQSVLRDEQARGALRQWTLKGRASTLEERASLRWRQNDQHFDLLLRGPFGLGGLRIEGTPQVVSVHDGREVTQSHEPQVELWRRTGWQLPLEALPYWVRGLPAPDLPRQLQRAPDGQLISIRQAGWWIYPADFQLVGDLLMPFSLRLQQDDWQLHIEVSQWTLN